MRRRLNSTTSKVEIIKKSQASFKIFVRYFGSYIFKSKTRQQLLFLAVVGLVLSSFSLIVLQSTMGGLQKKQIDRSIRILGNGSFDIEELNSNSLSKLKSYLKEKDVPYTTEYELELLVKTGSFLFPVIAHGIDLKEKPEFMENVEFKSILMPKALGYKYSLGHLDEITLISPSHVSTVFSDVPRMIVGKVDDFISTDVNQIDQFHIWLRDGLLHNLIRSRDYNKIRIYSSTYSISKLRSMIKSDLGIHVEGLSWEQQHQTLMWALGLESNMMIFLFIAMTFLVSLCITTGLLLFFDRTKIDLSTFWILGYSKKNIEKMNLYFLNLLSCASALIGIILGVLFLFGINYFGINVMSDLFMDRQLPIYITVKGVLIAFLIPYFISLIFSYFTFSQFKKDNDLSSYVRMVGR